MSILPKDSISLIAESVGVESLSDDIAQALAPDVEYRLREVVQEAIKFMRHSKRTTLTAEDISYALRLRNVEHLYGYALSKPLKFVRANGTHDLYYLEDDVVDFTDELSTPLPRCPRDISLATHWLAVEGVQPIIRQNPPPDVISQRMHNMNDRNKQTVAQQNGKATHTSQMAAASGQVLLSGTSSSNPSSNSSDIKLVVKHVISKELQVYYEKITQGLLSDNESLREAALTSLRVDQGIHQLLPYFTQFLLDMVTHNLRHLSKLHILMRMTESLLKSEHVQVELYLHQMMPAILTCVVGRRLCASSDEDHWALRRYAASLLAYICQHFGDRYKNMKSRITRTLLRALLDPTKPLTTHYGAVVGLSSLGHVVLELLLLPNLYAYMALLSTALEEKVPEGVDAMDHQAKRMEALHVYGALLDAASTYVRHAYRTLVSDAKESPSAQEAIDALCKTVPDHAQLYESVLSVFGDQITSGI